MILPKNNLTLYKYFPVLIFSLIACLSIYGLINGKEIWLWRDFLNDKTRFNQLYTDIVILLAGLFTFSLIKHNKLRLFACSVFFLVVYLSHKAVKLGDHDYWYYVSGNTKEALLSEFLGSVLYHIIAYIYKPFLFNISAVFGALTALSFLYYTNLLLNAKNDRKVFFIIALLYAASPIHLIFFSNFLEFTSTSVLFLPPYLYFCIMYLQTTDSKKAMIYFAQAAFSICLALLFHGMNLFLFPVLICCIVINATTLKNKLYQFLSFVIGSAALCSMIVLLVSIFGFIIISGHIGGGADGHAIKMLFGSKNTYQPDDLFSQNSFIEISNILLLCNFSAPYFMLSLLWLTRKNFSSFLFNMQTELVLIISALGYIGFIFLWNFDLGFPLDYDLMISMGIVLTILTAHFSIKICKVCGISKYALLQPILANMLYAWIYITHLS